MSIFRFEQSYGLQAHIFTPDHKLIKLGPARFWSNLPSSNQEAALLFYKLYQIIQTGLMQRF